MTQPPQIIEPKNVKRAVTRLRETCRQLDALNLQLDELIAKVEEDIRQSPLTQYRLKRGNTIKLSGSPKIVEKNL